MGYLLAKDVVASLGLTPRAIGTLIKVGLLNPSPVGTALDFSPSEVNKLSRRLNAQKVTLHGAVWVVRLGPPNETGDPAHPFTGWNENWDEDRKANAASRWWRIARPETYVGHALVATVGHFCVGVWNIVGGETNEHGDASFITAKPTSRQRRDFENRSWDLGPGPVVLHFDAQYS